MQKTLEGSVVSLKMKDGGVVEVTRKVAHPLYGKLMKRSKKYKVDLGGLELTVGDKVRIGEIRKMSKHKYFKVIKKL